MEKFNQSPEVYFYGSKEKIADKTKLKAGRIQLIYHNGNIKYLSIGPTEILRMIYAALRDDQWNTIPAQIQDEKIQIDGNRFLIKYKAVYQQRDIHFEANYTIEGSEDNRVRILMKGKSFSSFQKNRIGLCTLIPASATEKEIEIIHNDDNSEKGIIPHAVIPHPVFKDIKSMQWKPSDDIVANLDFTGDVFEMEDQRNYGDDSFKIYSTPIAEPFPTEMKKGDIIEQEVVISAEPATDVNEERADEPIFFEIIDNEVLPMPAIGVGRSSGTERLTEKEMELLASIRFAHVRVDLQLHTHNWQKIYHDALAEVMQNNYQLELALFFNGDVTKQARQVIEIIDPAQVKSVNLYAADQMITPEFILENIVPMLKKEWPHVKIGAGTDDYLIKLNANRIPNQNLDFVSYSLNPQVHLNDNESLIETAQGAGYGVQSAKQFSNAPVHVTPYTLKSRRRPDKQDISADKSALPPQIDIRQMALINAGLTIATLKYLAQAGVESVTFFETIGERGLMMGEKGPRYQDFIAEPFTFFPVYFVFRELLNGDDWQLVKTQSSSRLKVDGICIQKNGDVKVLLANLTAEKQIATISREPSLKAFVSYFDHLNAPEFYKNAKYKVVAETKLTNQELKVEMLPYAFVIIEFVFN